MSNKHILFGAAALALAGFMTPIANAADVPPAEEVLSPFSITLDGWAGYWFITGDKGNTVPTEDEGLIFGVDGKLRFDLFDGVSVQGDFSFDDVDENQGSDYYQGGLSGAGHLSWSNPDSGLFGIFGGAGRGESDDDNSDFWVVGGEGQIYWENLTLYGQAGYFDAKVDEGDEEDAFHNAWFGRIVGRYFFDPESRLQLEFAYANGEQDTDDVNMDVLNWGIRYDHQVISNMAVFAAYDGGYYDNGNGSDTGSYFDHVIKGGISISFGRPDLLSNDRTGPNLDTPDFARWGASGQNVD